MPYKWHLSKNNDFNVFIIKKNVNKKKLCSSADDDWLLINNVLCVRQAEARLAAKRAARAEAREIRLKELERHQKEVSLGPEPVVMTTMGGAGGVIMWRDVCLPEEGSKVRVRNQCLIISVSTASLRLRIYSCLRWIIHSWWVTEILKL